MYKGYWVSKTYKWLSIAYWATYSLYFRSITFFSAANPSIHLGGMLDECKSDIYKLVPPAYLPKSFVIESYNHAAAKKIAQQLGYPIILKPDIGYRGFMVKKVDSEASLLAVEHEYLGIRMLLQEYLQYPCEFSVLYYQINSQHYGISSITQKHLPIIVGDGINTVGQLVTSKDNPFLDKKWITKNLLVQLDTVLPKGKELIIDHVGNFSRGSSFENLLPKNNIALIECMHQFFSQITGLYFCRADVKANSFEALCRCEFKLLEINGAKSEPIHIYDESMTFLQIIATTHRHWTLLFDVVKSHQGVLMKKTSSMDGIRSYQQLKKLVS